MSLNRWPTRGLRPVLKRRLTASGYAEVGTAGPHEVLVRRGGSPLCLAVVEDWPMLTVFRLGARLRVMRSPEHLQSLRPPFRVIVRRGDDLEAVGEAVVNDDLSLEPQLPLPGTWALADPITPMGVDVEGALADLTLRLSPFLVILVRGYTSPLSAEMVPPFWAPRAPVLMAELEGFRPPPVRGRAIVMRLGPGVDPRPALEEAEEELRGLQGRGC
jgi:hypothetical protein